jgi:hypothetical protein
MGEVIRGIDEDPARHSRFDEQNFSVIELYQEPFANSIHVFDAASGKASAQLVRWGHVLDGLDVENGNFCAVNSRAAEWRDSASHGFDFWQFRHTPQ